jgi:asparagine synthase (glutamine-hydrolysing)
LQPGHYLIADKREHFIAKYWDLDYAQSEHEVVIEDELQVIEEFGRLFHESVRLRLRADTPVCCHVSGGLDSSAVLGVAAQYSSKLASFTVSFEEESYDELDISQEMAHCAGADIYPVQVSQSDLIEYLPDAVYFSEGLAVNGHLTAKYLLNKAIRRAGFKVALTGEGSDEVVAGYPHLRSDLFSATGQQHLLAGLHSNNRASAGIMLKHGESLPLTAVATRLGYVPGFLEAKGTLGHKICSVLSHDFKAKFASRDGYAELLDCFDVDGQLAGRNRVHQSLYLWSKTALTNYILRTLGDGMEMASSIEGRLPFLDHHLFEFVRNLPVSIKIKGTIEKYILREAVKPFITETIYKRRKHPFVAPPISAFTTPAASSALHDTLRSKSFASVPFFDQSKVIELLDRLPGMNAADRAATDPVLMTALSAAALQDRFKLRGMRS